ncbi:MAG: 2-oxoacid:acceptor oxidoreductase family protein [Clostridiaceae bacterium]|nr:2-oxoacid:acceptor oxidoreductase family protein [Clostridiaceae bacterium]
MKEIRLHGRGGQGVVKSAQILVKTVIDNSAYAHFIPFFGVERKGSPVFGFVRFDNKNIRTKCQVYNPDCVLIFDDTLLGVVPVFEGLKGEGIVIINTTKSMEQLQLPAQAKKAAIVDATGIALELLGRGIPNTAMLGAFARATGWVDMPALEANIEEKFGQKNTEAAKMAFDKTRLFML